MTAENDTGRAGDGDGAHWELFSHDADIGVRGIGSTPARAFEQAAVAMTAVICDPARVEAREVLDIECAAGDLDLMFVDWLNALVLEMATRKMLFSTFDVTLDESGLHARVGGEDVDVARHEPAAEVKGATLTELDVRKGSDGLWRAQCVVDV